MNAKAKQPPAISQLEEVQGVGNKVTALMNATQNTNDLPLLGAVCWFDLQSGASRAGLENALLAMPNKEASELIRTFIPAQPKPEQSFNYAISHASTGYTEHRIEKVKQDDAMTVAGILHRQERYDDEGNIEGVDFVQSHRVALILRDKAGDALPEPVIAHEKTGCKIGGRLESLYNWHRDYLTPDDIRPMVTQTFDSLYRLNLRRSGGMYFVAAEFLDIIRSLFDLLLDLSCGGYLLPIFETTEALETLGACAEDNTLDDVGALLSELEKFDKALEDGKVMRAATLEARQDKLDDLRSKASLYGRVLRHDVQAIEKAFKGAEDKLIALATKRDNVIDKK